MELKHTPGPWHVGDFGHIVTEYGDTICQMHNGRDSDYNNRLNNETLIATAPDLLKEAERYLPILQRLENEFPSHWEGLTEGTGIATTNGLRNAIKKATS